MLGVCETDTVCPNTSCQLNFTSTKTKGYFLEQPEKQLKNILEKKHTSSLLQQRFSRDKKDSNCISDIYDGNIYTSFSGPGGPLSEEFPYNVSLLGIQIVFLFSKVLSSLYGHFTQPLMSYHISKEFKRKTCYFVVFGLENLSQI